MFKLHSKRILAMLLCVLSVAGAWAQVTELKGKVVSSINTTAATTLKEGQWYLMQNRGRKAYDYENLAKSQVGQSASVVAAGDEITESNAGYLMQLVAAGGDNQYYIMTGYGHWLSDITVNDTPVTTTADESQRGVYTVGKFTTNGHWYLKSAGGYVLDGNGSSAVGWGTGTPTTEDGNNDHAFYAIMPGEPGNLTGTALVNKMLKDGGIFRFISQRTTSMVMADPTDMKVVSQTKKNTDQTQWWLLQPLANGGVALRNYSTGRYIQVTSGTSAWYTTGIARATLYAKASAKSTASKGLLTIASKPSYDGKVCLHDDAAHHVVNWLANNAAGENPCSDWGVEPVEEVDLTTVKDHFATLSGHLTPSNGITVQIRNAETGDQISENGNGKLIAVAPNAEDFSQYWVMEQTSGNQYSFRNVQTGHYFSYVNGSGNYNDQKAAASKTSYVIAETSDAWERTYHITTSSNPNLYYTHTNSGKGPNDRDLQYIVNSTTDEARTHWVFVKTELDAEDITASQQAFEAYTDIKANINTYTTKMNDFFTDGSYSELKAEYQSTTDTGLTVLMQKAGLPDYLIKIALKVKNNTWSEEDKMSRDFRVADYQVYSHFLDSKALMGMGHGFGRLSNPTGVVTKSGDIVSVFCDQAAPADCDLMLEVVENTDAYGQTYVLNKGINIFNIPLDATLYVFYQAKNLNVKLASCPNIRVHIEGGRLNGYFDKTRGHTDQTWKHLRQNLLKASKFINIKTPNFVFCFDNQRVQNACPTYMERVLQAWDNMAFWENELMGYNETWIPGISEIQRNIYNWFSKDVYMGGSMMTALYGVQTLSGNIAGHMDYQQMEGDGVFGPAHECGHLRQNLVCTVGSMEASCNLFSEVVIYHLGRSTQRNAYSSAIFDKLAQKKTWADYSGNEITRLLYQLYLYFHVNGVMPDFYPRLFTELRKDPMVQNRTTSLVKGGEEYLKLARTVCKVANADLSEFFETYGYFVPLASRNVTDGGLAWKLSTTQEEIDETLAYMHSLPKKYGNITFIEDRVEPVPATYEGHAANETKKGYNRADAGELGQFTAYLKQPKLENYCYTVTDAGKVTVKGDSQTGLVGFKVYDKNGKLAFASNRFSFTLPADLLAQDYKLVAAMGDGSDIELSAQPVSTGVGKIAAQPSASKQMFDLQGRRVMNPMRGGIYIMNGKKFVY